MKRRGRTGEGKEEGEGGQGRGGPLRRLHNSRMARRLCNVNIAFMTTKK